MTSKKISMEEIKARLIIAVGFHFPLWFYYNRFTMSTDIPRAGAFSGFGAGVFAILTLVAVLKCFQSDKLSHKLLASLLLPLPCLTLVLVMLWTISE